jgi:putative acetyltransferase
MTDSPMHIRRAKPGEASELLRLHADTIRRVNSKDYDEDQLTLWLSVQSLDRMEAAISDGLALVCINDRKRILGFSVRRGAEIRGLYVAADCQAQGIGKAILARLEEEALAEGVGELTAESTTTALPFYSGQGYLETGRALWPADRRAGLEVVAIRKRLGAPGTRGMETASPRP